MSRLCILACATSSVRRMILVILTCVCVFSFSVALPRSAGAQQAGAALPTIQVSPSAEKPARSLPKRKKRVDAKPKPRPVETNTASENAPSDVVTSPSTLPTPVGQVASSVSVITAQDIQRNQWRSVPDALRTVPGLNVVQNGGPGAQTSVFIRGTNSNHTKILIDGIDVGDPSTPNGAFDLGQLTTADIDRIEVLRGPQSGLYGSDAIGGVISITTRKGEGPAKVAAMAEGGSHGTFNSAAGLSGSQDRFNYALNVSNYQTTSSPVTPLELLQPGQRRINDEYFNRTVSTRLGYDLTEDFALNLTGRYTDAKLNFTGDQSPFPFPASSFPGDLQSSQHSEQLFSRTEAVWSLFDGRFKNYFGVDYAKLDRFNVNPYTFEPFGTTFVNPTTTTNNGERLKYDWRGVISVLKGQTVVLGVEQQKERFKNTSSSNGATGASASSDGVVAAERNSTGVYAELQSNFSDRLFVTSNVRMDDFDNFGEHSTFRVAPAFIVPGTETKLKGSYGTGFKAPTLSQLYDTTYLSNNPNLKPEESKGYDVGFEQPVANGRVNFGTTYFNNDVQNLIQFGPAFVLENIGMAKTSGFETFAALKFNDRFDVRFDYTNTKAIDAINNTELLNRPKDKSSWMFNWRPVDDLTLTATVILSGPYQNFNRSGDATVTNPGYRIVNLAANYTVAPGVVTFARIDNLLNEQYQDPTGFMRPAFGVFGGLRVTSVAPGAIASR